MDGEIMENPIKMDDLGVPLFLETPIHTSFHLFPLPQYGSAIQLWSAVEFAWTLDAFYGVGRIIFGQNRNKKKLKCLDTLEGFHCSKDCFWIIMEISNWEDHLSEESSLLQITKNWTPSTAKLVRLAIRLAKWLKGLLKFGDIVLQIFLQEWFGTFGKTSNISSPTKIQKWSCGCDLIYRDRIGL